MLRAVRPVARSAVRLTRASREVIAVVETTTDLTWHHIREHLDELHIGTFTGAAGTYRQRTELTKPQRDILA